MDTTDDVIYRYSGAAWVQWEADPTWTAFTPSWGAVNSAPSVGNGSLVGRYRRLGPKTIMLRVFLTFGSTTSGGLGGWSFALPPGITAHAQGEQILPVKGYLAGLAANFPGVAYVSPSGTAITPMLPVGTSDSYMNQVRNADASGAVNTGVPLYPGNYSFINGANMTIQGTLETL